MSIDRRAYPQFPTRPPANGHKQTVAPLGTELKKSWPMSLAASISNLPSGAGRWYFKPQHILNVCNKLSKMQPRLSHHAQAPHDQQASARPASHAFGPLRVDTASHSHAGALHGTNANTIAHEMNQKKPFHAPRKEVFCKLVPESAQCCPTRE